jgi:hypothetical protein
VERGGSSVGKVGEWYVKSWHLQGCSPHLYRLRTDGLAPASKYWTYQSHAGDMDLVSQVACYQQKSGLSLLVHWLAWERNWVRKLRSAGMLWIVSGAFFLRSSGIHPNPSMTHERLPRMGTAHRKRTPDVRGLTWKTYVSYWSGFLLQGVYQFESPRLSDMSNRLFVSVFTYLFNRIIFINELCYALL